MLNKIGDKIEFKYQAKWKEANLTYIVDNIEKISNGYVVTLKIPTYNGTSTQTVTIENGKVISSTRRYGGKDLNMNLEKGSYNFKFSEQKIEKENLTHKDLGLDKDLTTEDFKC